MRSRSPANWAPSSPVDRRPGARSGARRPRCSARPRPRGRGRDGARGPEAGRWARRAAPDRRRPSGAARRRGRRAVPHGVPRARRRARPDAPSRATPASPGSRPTTSPEGVVRAADWPFATAAEREDYERVERLYGALVATVDHADPWSHPDASMLDGASLGDWLRSVDASPAVIRCLATGALALADGSIEYTSLLSELRKSAVAEEPGLLRLRPVGIASGQRGQRRGGRAAGAHARGADPARRRGRIRVGVGERLLGASRRRRASPCCCGCLRVTRRRSSRRHDRRCRTGADGVAACSAERPRCQGGDGLRPARSGPTSEATGSQKATV